MSGTYEGGMTFEQQHEMVLGHFVYNLKMLRMSKELSGVELSKRLKMSEKRVNDLEGQRMPPNLDDLIRIVDFFEICFDDLLGYKIPLKIGSKENQGLP